jgi:hypothetical protein
MSKFVLSIVVTLLLAAPALAQETPEEMFRNAYEDVIFTVARERAALEEAEELDKAEKKALKAFTKVEKMAAKLADKYGTPGTDKKSLKKVGKIVKTIEKAVDTQGGVDTKSVGLLLPAVQKAMSDLFDAIRTVVEDAESEAESEQGELTFEKYIRKVAKQLDKAFDKADAGDMYLTSYAKWAKAWANYLKAVTTYVKAAVIAGKLYEKEQRASGGVNGLVFDANGKLVNNTGGTVQLTDLIYDLTFKVPNAPQQTVKFKLSDVSPQSLPIDLGTNAFDPTTYSQIWSGLSVIQGIRITGKIVYQTTAGNLTYKFN